MPVVIRGHESVPLLAVFSDKCVQLLVRGNIGGGRKGPDHLEQQLPKLLVHTRTGQLCQLATVHLLTLCCPKSDGDTVSERAVLLRATLEEHRVSSSLQRELGTSQTA